MIKHLSMLASYNQWINQILLLKINQAEVFSGEVSTKLNHILLGDKVWLNRFNEALRSSVLSNCKLITELDYSEIVSIEEFIEQREELDGVILKFIDSLSSDDLKRKIKYALKSEETYIEPFDELILHLFNHQTHHRGQIIMILAKNGIDCGLTDVLGYIRQNG